MYQAVIFSFKVLQNFIVYESAEDRNLRAFFNQVKNSLSCNVFTRQCCDWDALLTCQWWTSFLEPSFFARALKMVQFKSFWLTTIWRGAAFHFLSVFSKKEILWKLWLWFSKMFHQRVFSDWKWRISKFPFWRQIVDIYRQLLLNLSSFKQRKGNNIYRLARTWNSKLYFVQVQ